MHLPSPSLFLLLSLFLPLSLSHTQLQAAITSQIPPESIGLELGSSLLGSIKHCVVQLARNSNVLETVQTAAQRVLQSSWLILLPSVSERAGALYQLLPSGDGERGCHTQRAWRKISVADRQMNRQADRWIDR